MPDFKGDIMSDEIKVEEYYRKKGKELVDLLFDKNFLNSELTRQSLNWLEDYIGFLMQSQAQITEKSTLLLARLKET